MTKILQEAQELLNQLFEGALKSGETIRLEASDVQEPTLRLYVGTRSKAHVFEFKAETKADEVLMLLLDYAQGVLTEFFASNRRAGFSVAFTKREFEERVLWVRQEYHDFDAEGAADKLLAQDDAKKRSKIG